MADIKTINTNINLIINNGRFLRMPLNFGSAFAGDHLVNISNELTRYSKFGGNDTITRIYAELQSICKYCEYDDSIPRLVCILESVRLLNNSLDELSGYEYKKVNKIGTIGSVIRWIDKVFKTKWYIIKLRNDICKEVGYFKFSNDIFE